MSLTMSQRMATSAELWHNLIMSGAGEEIVRIGLGMEPQQFRAAMDLTAESRPEDTWLLRDYLEKLVVSVGGTPLPYTVLTEEARAAARRWFPLREAPEVQYPYRHHSAPHQD